MAWTQPFEDLYQFLKALPVLVRDTETNRDEIRDLREELKEATDLLHRLAFEVQRISDREKSEREKQDLRIENLKLQIEKEFLKERRLIELSSGADIEDLGE